jgi:hypothetical protein
MRIKLINLILIMAYPVKLFDFGTPEGEQKGKEFLSSIDPLLFEVFGHVDASDHIKKHVSWSTDEVPHFLKTLATEHLVNVIKKLPEGELKWSGTMGMYGRKDGTVIKRSDKILYRMVINIGSTEIYHLSNQQNMSNPIVLPNGYALLLSPEMICSADVRVHNNPIRKDLSQDIAKFVEKIRLKDYLRLTIVLDLSYEGLELPS